MLDDEATMKTKPKMNYMESYRKAVRILSSHKIYSYDAHMARPYDADRSTIITTFDLINETIITCLQIEDVGHNSIRMIDRIIKQAEDYKILHIVADPTIHEYMEAYYGLIALGIKGDDKRAMRLTSRWIDEIISKED